MESNKELKDIEVFEEGFYFIFCNYYIFGFWALIIIFQASWYEYSRQPPSKFGPPVER